MTKLPKLSNEELLARISALTKRVETLEGYELARIKGKHTHLPDEDCDKSCVHK